MSIVVTGIGIVSPLGLTAKETWRNLIAGQTGIVPTEAGLSAPVKNFSLNGARSRTGDFALDAAAEALQASGILTSTVDPDRVGCSVSTSKPILNSHYSTSLDAALLMATFCGFAPEELIRKKFHFSGPSSNVIAACATGVASIELGAYWISSGQCDVVLVGAAESSLNTFYRAGFDQMGVLVKGDASAACPFDSERAGFVMGEGAAVLILESEAHARQRKAPILSRLTSVTMAHSASDAVRFDVDGLAVSRLIRKVMKTSGFPSYINAHGTGTRFNDVIETKGIKSAFGQSAHDIAISSTKAATGHLLGAAGAIEAAFCVLALRDQVVPPTLHLTHPDSDCDLDYVPRSSRKISVTSTLSLSYGFGGQMGAVLFQRV